MLSMSRICPALALSCAMKSEMPFADGFVAEVSPIGEESRGFKNIYLNVFTLVPYINYSYCSPRK